MINFSYKEGGFEGYFALRDSFEPKRYLIYSPVKGKGYQKIAPRGFEPLLPG